MRGKEREREGKGGNRGGFFLVFLVLGEDREGKGREGVSGVR